jgi:hypothetical protein
LESLKVPQVVPGEGWLPNWEFMSHLSFSMKERRGRCGFLIIIRAVLTYILQKGRRKDSFLKPVFCQIID